MRLYIKYDLNATCKTILQEQLEKLNLIFTLAGIGEVGLDDNVSDEALVELKTNLSKYGIEILENPKSILVQKIKDTIIEMVNLDDEVPPIKISVYLSDKLKLKYSHISKIFSDFTYTSVANFIILQKTELAKQLIISNELSISEIAFKLNYSSTAHFTNQFKNITGLTPTTFQRIMNKRRNSSIKVRIMETNTQSLKS
jgi:AraC-like DNA-binding protein